MSPYSAAMTTQCPISSLSEGPDVNGSPLCRLSDNALRALSDDDLLRLTGELTRRSRHTEVALLAHLAEIDARGLYLREACSSLFAYCTERLHFSDGEAHYRIAAARAAREHPVVLDMLADGRLHLTAVALLAPHLTAENRDAVLSRAVHRSKRRVEELVAELSPRPDVPSLIRKLPTGIGAAPSAAGTVSPAVAPVSPATIPASLASLPANVDRSDSPVSADGAGAPLRPTAPQPPAPPRSHAASAVIEPLAPGRHKVQFTASTELRDKLERLRALMLSTVPDGDLATVIDRAVTRELARLERRKSATTDKPRKSLADTDVSASSRHVPAAVRRSVHARDGDRCASRDDQGRRCTARVWLELHHRHPYGFGGDHAVENVATLCRAHNRYLATIDYGPRKSSS